MMISNFKSFLGLVLFTLNLQNKQVTCASVRGHVLGDGGNDTNNNERQYHSSVQRRAKKDMKDDKNDSPGDRNYGNGNYIEEYYDCVTVQELNAAGKKFLHPMDKHDPEENAILNAAGNLVPPESCSCDGGCCRTYQWLVCDTEGYLPYIPCICNQNTRPRAIDSNQGIIQVEMNPSPFAGLTQPGSGVSFDRSFSGEPEVATQANENYFPMYSQSNPAIPGLPTQPGNSQQQSSGGGSGTNGASILFSIASP